VPRGAGAVRGSLLSSAEPDSVLPVSLRPLRRSATRLGTSPLLISIQTTAEAGKGPDSDSLVRIEARFLETALPAGGIGRRRGRNSRSGRDDPEAQPLLPQRAAWARENLRGGRPHPGNYRRQQERNPGFCHSGRSRPSTPGGCFEVQSHDRGEGGRAR